MLLPRWYTLLFDGRRLLPDFLSLFLLRAAPIFFFDAVFATMLIFLLCYTTTTLYTHAAAAIRFSLMPFFALMPAALISLMPATLFRFRAAIFFFAGMLYA